MSLFIKYLFILFCFCLCLARNYRFLYVPRTCFRILALFFTVCADYFLLFTDLYLTGVFLFCIVQYCYSIFLGNRSIFLTLPLLFVFVYTDSIVLMALLYILYLCMNIYGAYRTEMHWFMSALILMLLCDIHVGLANLPCYLPLHSNTLLHTWCSLSAYIFWFFYLPSQLMISLIRPNVREKVHIVLPKSSCS